MTRRDRWYGGWVAVLLVGAIGACREPAAPEPARKTNGGAAAAPRPGEAPAPVFKTDAQGLENLIEAMAAARKSGDNAAYDRIARGLALPDPNAWFARRFGDRGTAPAAVYLDAGLRASLLGQALDQQIAAKGDTGSVQITAVPLDEAKAIGLVKEMIAAAKEPLGLYEVYVEKERFRYFTVEGGAWRCVDKMWPSFRRQ